MVCCLKSVYMAKRIEVFGVKQLYNFIDKTVRCRLPKVVIWLATLVLPLC